MQLLRGIVRGYDAVSHRATVQLPGSTATFHAGIPVASHVPAGHVVPGAACAVLTFDEQNPDNTLVIAVVGPPVAHADLIGAVDVAAPTQTISFTGLPQTYGSLQLVVYGRSTGSGGVQVRFNGDSGPNYDLQQLSGAGTMAGAGEVLAATAGTLGEVAASSLRTTIGAGFDAIIPGYAQTAFEKTWISRVGVKLGESSSAMRVRFNAGFWRSTAAVSRIDLFLADGISSFVPGTRAALYGLP